MLWSPKFGRYDVAWYQGSGINPSVGRGDFVKGANFKSGPTISNPLSSRAEPLHRGEATTHWWEGTVAGRTRTYSVPRTRHTHILARMSECTSAYRTGDLICLRAATGVHPTPPPSPPATGYVVAYRDVI